MNEQTHSKKKRPNRGRYRETRRDETRPFWQSLSAQMLIVAVLAFVAHIGALKAGFIWDDDDYITQNIHLLTPLGLWKIWTELGATPQYYPLVHSTFWIEYRLWGLSSAGFHFTNMLLHAFNSLLVFLLLRRFHVWGALFGAALFAVHPVHVETVAWATERKNVLSGFFYLVSMLAYFRFVDLQSDVTSERAGWKWYAIALAAFVAALFSKTVASTLPAAILVILWWQRTPGFWRHAKLLSPFFVVGLVLGLVTIYVEKAHVGATGKEFDLSPLERLLIAGRAPWFYVGKLIAPVDLSFIYPRWKLDPSDSRQWMYPILLLAMLSALTFSVLRMHWTKGDAPELPRRVQGIPGARSTLAAVLLFLGTLFPALGFFNVYPFRYSFVADHFQYLASVPMLALFGAALTGLARVKKFDAGIALAFGVVVVGALGMLSYKQTINYRSQEALWTDTLRKNPTSDLALTNLGNIYTESERFAESEILYRKAIQLNPDDEFAHYNLGVAMYRQGKLTDARYYLREAVKIQSDYAPALFNLGLISLDEGNVAAAIPYFENVLKINPNMHDARLSLARALATAGRMDDADREYKVVVTRNPNSPIGHFNYADFLVDQGRIAEALARLQTVTQLTPRDVEAWYQVALLSMELERFPEARQALEAVLSLDPNHVEARQLITGPDPQQATGAVGP